MSKFILFLTGNIFIFSINPYCQNVNDTITAVRVEKIITYLASDKMMSRVNYTKEQLEAAEYISKEFSSYGLEPFPVF